METNTLLKDYNFAFTSAAIAIHAFDMLARTLGGRHINTIKADTKFRVDNSDIRRSWYNPLQLEINCFVVRDENDKSYSFIKDALKANAKIQVLTLYEFVQMLVDKFQLQMFMDDQF